jgi:hypothetical protein
LEWDAARERAVLSADRQEQYAMVSKLSCLVDQAMTVAMSPVTSSILWLLHMLQVVLLSDSHGAPLTHATLLGGRRPTARLA